MSNSANSSQRRRNKVVVAGGTGQIGRHLCRRLRERGDEVVVLTRGEAGAGRAQWDGRTLGPWAAEIDGADWVINLAGRTVDCRYNPENRRQIYASRIDSTTVIGQAIAAAERPPALWFNASTATIYVDSRDTPQGDGPVGPGGAAAGSIWTGDEDDVEETWLFSVDVAKRWEQALDAVPTPATRKVALRASMVMDWEPGGVFSVLSRLVRFGLGGKQGDGGQYVAWIHIEDFLRAIDFIAATPSLAGPVNVCSPNPLPNAEFMAELRRAWGRRWGLPAARWMLEIGAVFLRTETELVLKSRYVVPSQLLAAGFSFDYPEFPAAARDLVARARGA